MIKGNLVEHATDYARAKHRGQMYSNEPFIFHPLLTSEIIRLVAPDDENLIAAAVLHDIIENTEDTYDDLLEKFGEDIAGLIQEVTKSEYNTFPNLKSTRAVTLKFADRTANLSSMQRGGWSEEKQQKYIAKSKFWKP